MEGAGARSNTASEPKARLIAGRYRLVAPLGRGGFGEVWDAEDTLLGERVALKRMHRTGPESPRTRREIATLRMLRLPGVVRLFDEGDDDGCSFFVMERVSGAPFPGRTAAPAPDPLVSSTLDARPDGQPSTTQFTTLSGAPPSETAFSETAFSETAGSAVEPSAARTPAARRAQPRWSWDAIAGVTEALFETLGRVHGAGVVHRDLKPSNVLVQSDGRPILLDFGLCLPTAEGARPTGGPARIEGTPMYLAPEQIRGGSIDARADLYSAGVMLHESLTGRIPNEAPTLEALLVLRATQRPPAVRSVCPTIPAHVAEVIDRLLSPHPAERPRSAAEVLDALRVPSAQPIRTSAPRRPARRLPEREAIWSESALRQIFSGRQRLFHLPEDAARALLARTSGIPARVGPELDAWIDAGIARSDGDRLHVDREALDRIELGFPTLSADPAASGEVRTGRAGADRGGGALNELFFSQIRAGHDADAAEVALALARRLGERGRHGLAASMLTEGLSASRRTPDATLEIEMLDAWVGVAFAEQTPQAIDRVLYEVCRARHRADPHVARLERLLRAAISVRTFLSSDPAIAVEDLEPFEDPALERWRTWIRLRAWLYTDMQAAERVLGDAVAWSERTGDPIARAAAAGFRGTALYVQGRFAEAARWHAEAASGEPWLTLKIAQMLNEAAALVEAFQPERAGEVARRAARLAAQCRHPLLEGRAEWTTRDAAYRTGQSLTPDLELIESIADLSAPDLLGVACLTEAAVAFRCEDHELSARLAQRAVDTWQRAGQRSPAMLARTLAGAVGGGLSLAEAEELAAQAAECPVPGVGIQALGLLRWACPPLPPRAPGVIEALSALVPAERRGDRMDVLSVEEACAAVRGERAMR
ncbi:MAG: serine/threonine-protein kinase [Polyangiaceae bacterium]